jgi:hypothetical protein
MTHGARRLPYRGFSYGALITIAGAAIIVGAAGSASAAPKTDVLVASTYPAAANPKFTCQDVTGSPGTVSFTANVAIFCTGEQIRAYCKYYSIATGYGGIITGVGNGLSKATCSGITSYGYQQRATSTSSWVTYQLGT